MAELTLLPVARLFWVELTCLLMVCKLSKFERMEAVKFILLNFILSHPLLASCPRNDNSGVTSVLYTHCNVVLI